jgi:hypothetical protein
MLSIAHMEYMCNLSNFDIFMEQIRNVSNFNNIIKIIINDHGVYV